MLSFHILSRGASPPPNGINQVYLVYDRWNDFSYVTMFYVYVHDERGELHELGNVKIGFVGQTTATETASVIDKQFSKLGDNFFSVGNDVEFYKVLGHSVSSSFRDQFTSSLRDIVANEDSLNRAKGEEVFKTSLLRDISLGAIEGQFRRILGGGVPLTDFHFSYHRKPQERMSEVTLSFRVTPQSAPGTNIHAIIGRNGVGKTTVLNGMIEAITQNNDGTSQLMSNSMFGLQPIDKKYFSRLISVSFSAFDPFPPPPEQSDPEKGTCYYYIGLKERQISSRGQLKAIDDMHSEFVHRLADCMRIPSKRDRWNQAITTLESDSNFREMELKDLASKPINELEELALRLIRKMSSGHAIVLLTITSLVARVEEKTLVLLDEPESHLHPPLLSAFTRALAELLVGQNGVSIIATHSPVVLQEVPRSCVWLLTRSGLAMAADRPTIETFGENVGILTSEVFKLEVAKSGFHTILHKEVFSENLSYAQIESKYNGQIGLEAKSIITAMIYERDGRVL